MEKKNFEFNKKAHPSDDSEKRARRGSEEKVPRERRPRKNEPGVDKPYTSKKSIPSEYTSPREEKSGDFKYKKTEVDKPKRNYEKKVEDTSNEQSSRYSDKPKVFREKNIGANSDFSKGEFQKDFKEKSNYVEKRKIWEKDERPRKFNNAKEGEEKPSFGSRKKEWNKDERPKKFDASKEYGSKPSFSERKEKWNADAKPTFGSKREYVKKEFTEGTKPKTGDNIDKRNKDWGKSDNKDVKPTNVDWKSNSKIEFVDKPYSKNKDFKKGKPIKQDWEKPLESPDYAKRSSPKVFRDKKVKKQTLEELDGKIRLNKYISNAGICSRREADDLIRSGAIKVNGKVISELGFRISPTDKIQYGDETLSKEVKRYVLLNKPKDYITTSNDPEGRKTVMELVKNACKERLYPVGRLDRATTGLLLMTNDGELAKKLTHPSHQVKKIYHVSLDKNLKAVDLKKITEGVTLEDGLADVDEIAYVGEGKDKTEIGIALHSGKNRIVRRIFEHLGYEVIKLDRTFFAGLTKKDLPRGNYRLLTEKEIINLRMA
jgi:23S rRNA pseudouridine2605 synthase